MRHALQITLAATSTLMYVSPALCFQVDERVEWIYQIPSATPGNYIGVADDGHLYVTDNFRMYALTSAGNLQWTNEDASGGDPVTIAPDGTIYTSANGIGVTAVNPDGSTRWVYTPPTSLVLASGPNLAPDGNVYAMQEWAAEGGLGMFSVDSTGTLRWSNKGNPLIGRVDLGHPEVVFSAGQCYTGYDGFRGGGVSSYAFTRKGDQAWYTGLGDLEIPATNYPAVLSDGRIAFRWGQIGVMTVFPDGQTDWITEHPDAALLIGPAIGPDDVMYTGDWGTISLAAFNPDGSIRWTGARDSSQSLLGLTMAPDNSVLLAWGAPGWVGAWIRGYDPNNGDLLWQIDLPYENGLPPYVFTSRVAFSPDSQTAYITVSYWNDAIQHSYVYAIYIGNGPRYSLTVDNLVGGGDAVFTISGATPQQKQYIAYSIKGLGSTWVPQLNVTLDLSRPELLGSGPANANGTFQMMTHIPRSAIGRTVWFQGAETNRTTAVVEQIVQ